MLVVNSSLKWEIHLIPHKSPSVESALLYQSFQRTFLQHFSEGLIYCEWRKGCVFLHRFLCVHLPVLIVETECNLHKSRVGKRGYEDCCCLPLISKMESMAIVRKGLWEGGAAMTTNHCSPALTKWEPTEGWNMSGRVQPPQTETHWQIVHKVSPARQSTADISNRLFRLKTKHSLCWWRCCFLERN